MLTGKDVMNYIVYTDGSFRNTPFGPFYAGAAAIIIGDEVRPSHLLSKVGNDDIVSMQNVAGEIIAVMAALEHLLNIVKVQPTDTIEIRYDYLGIEAWTKDKNEPGYWKAKNPTTQAYRGYIQTVVRQRCKVKFTHVKGHSGDPGNNLVDHMCRDAIDQHIDRLRSGVK